MVTPKMLGHIRPDFILNYSSKPGYVFPAFSNYLTIYNGYMYEFFTSALKKIAVYKVYTDDDDYIVDFELVNIVYLDKAFNVYRWIVIDGYALAFGINVSSSESGPTVSSSNSSVYTGSASASVNLSMAAYKLDGKNVVETIHNAGTLCSSGTSGSGNSALSIASGAVGNAMIDDNGEVRMAFRTSAIVGNSSYTDGAIVHFNLHSLVEGIEAGTDLSSIILTEPGIGPCYMIGFNEYIMCSQQIPDGSTSKKNGYWKYSILDDNSCIIDTSATLATPSDSDIPNIFKFGGFRFGIINHEEESFIYTTGGTSTREATWSVIYNNRKNLDAHIQHTEGFVSKNDQIPYTNAMNGYFINYTRTGLGFLTAFDNSNHISSKTATASTSVHDIINNVYYATKLDKSNSNMTFHTDRVKLPWLHVPTGHIITYGNRWYSIGGVSATDPLGNNRVAVSNLYGRTLFTIIEYDESTDTFYNVIKGHKPAVSASNSIVEITRIDYIIYNADITSNNAALFMFIADNLGRLYPISWKKYIGGTAAYSSTDTYLVPTGTLDFSNNPIILNPGNSLYILSATPEFPEEVGIYPEFTIYGCELTNS